jgi:hypothetical protein
MSTPEPDVVTDASPVSGFGEFTCWVVSRTNGLNIRESSSENSTSLGHLDLGQSLPASCLAERGAPYTDCGGVMFGFRSHTWGADTTLLRDV